MNNVCYSVFQFGLYSLQCHRRIHASRSIDNIEESYITPLNDQIERRGKQLVE